MTVDESGNLFELTLSFRGFADDPDVLSSALDLSPNHVARIGGCTTLADGTVLRYASRVNEWSYREEHRGKSNFANRLSRLVARLLPAIDFLLDLNKRCESAGNLIVRLPGEIHSGSEVDNATVRHIASLGVNLCFEAVLGGSAELVDSSNVESPPGKNDSRAIFSCTLLFRRFPDDPDVISSALQLTPDHAGELANAGRCGTAPLPNSRARSIPGRFRKSGSASRISQNAWPSE
jgi:hypothetical protein